jgi:hypothetical protein
VRVGPALTGIFRRYVLLMERNKLMTVKYECRRQNHIMPRPDRLRKVPSALAVDPRVALPHARLTPRDQVRQAMAALKNVLQERQNARLAVAREVRWCGLGVDEGTTDAHPRHGVPRTFHIPRTQRSGRNCGPRQERRPACAALASPGARSLQIKSDASWG